MCIRLHILYSYRSSGPVPLSCRIMNFPVLACFWKSLSALVTWAKCLSLFLSSTWRALRLCSARGSASQWCRTALASQWWEQLTPTLLSYRPALSGDRAMDIRECSDPRTWECLSCQCPGSCWRQAGCVWTMREQECLRVSFCLSSSWSPFSGWGGVFPTCCK